VKKISVGMDEWKIQKINKTLAMGVERGG